jgi:hypothetical protein
LIALGDGFVKDVHVEFAGGGGEGLKGKDFELDAEGRVFHFKGADDFLVGGEFVDDAMEPVFIAAGIGGFQLIAAVALAGEFQDFGAHPLFEEIGFGVGLKEEFDGQIEFPGDGEFGFAVLGVDLSFWFHGGSGLGVFPRETGLMFFHDGFELIEALIPHLAEGFDEVGDGFHFLGVDVVIHFPAALFLLEQLAFGENVQVPGNGGAGGIKIGGDGAGGEGLRGEQQEDGPARGVGNGLKGIAA